MESWVLTPKTLVGGVLWKNAMATSGGEPPLVQVCSDAEALMVVQECLQRLRSSQCSIPREDGRRREVQFVVQRARNYVHDAADPATAARVVAALEGAGLSDLTKLKLLNAKATTEIKAYLAEPELEDPAGVAATVERAWAAGGGGGGGGGGGRGGGSSDTAAAGASSAAAAGASGAAAAEEGGAPAAAGKAARGKR